MIEARASSEIMANDQVDVHKKAHLVLSRNRGAGAWLTSLPNSPDTHLSSPLFTTSLRRRLRMTVWDKDSGCPLCGQTQDRWGDHALSCLCGGDRVGHHNAGWDVVHSIARDCCSLAPIKEMPGLLPPRAPDGGDRPPLPAPPDPPGLGLYRPADIRVPHGPSGQAEAWNFSTRSALGHGIPARRVSQSPLPQQRGPVPAWGSSSDPLSSTPFEEVGPAALAFCPPGSPMNAVAPPLPPPTPVPPSPSASRQPFTGERRG